MSQREDKAEELFDLQLDYMEQRFRSALSGGEPLHPSELKEIRSFLADQGITCLGSKNSKAKALASSLPVNVSQLKTGTKQ